MTSDVQPAVVRDQLRREMQQQRAELSAAERDAAAWRLVDHIFPLLIHARTIAVYAATRGELSCTPLLTQLEDRVVAWPRVYSREGEMRFIAATRAELTPGAWGIDEPPARDELAPDRIDAILIPGTAFTPQGGRLGMGGGFYDRYLPRLRDDALRIGVGYHWQLVPTFPLEQHDMHMTHIATDRALLEVAAATGSEDTRHG